MVNGGKYAVHGWYDITPTTVVGEIIRGKPTLLPATVFHKNLRALILAKLEH